MIKPETTRVLTVNIEDEMKSSYLDYAMSVIVGRALPDVRDGLKPVHRRILYAMNDLGNVHNKPYKKSARIVGDVIGKYHPHGDVAVYDTIVRMAQDFSLRYPLIDGQGNFGSIDGDSAAAMRYTEIRMSRFAEELLADIEKETVDFGPNYDDSLKEPLILPSRIPNLLVNGSSGIAVGMATNIPPHNLTEVADALALLIKKPDASFEEIFKLIQGPDFPTAGFIYGKEGIREAYETGRGIIQIRGKATIEPTKKGDREHIIVTEIPYQVNKAKLIEKIAELVRDKKIEGISDLRDESDRDGLRIVIELKKGEVSAVILNNLYKHTPLQSSYGIILLGLENNQPKVFKLQEMLSAFILHRKEIVTKRCVFDLKKAEERAHILEGLKIALENIDAVVQLIKKSKSVEEARAGLMKKFMLSEMQAQAILDLRLQKLTNLERTKILEEYEATIAEIKRLRKILGSEEEIYKLILAELEEIKKKYGDPRRTEIVKKVDEITLEDMIAEEEVVVTITRLGYIKRSPLEAYRSQRRGGKGARGAGTREEDNLTDVFTASTHSYLLCFTDKGKMYWLRVHRVPEAARTAKGKAIVNLVPMNAGERILATVPVLSFDEDKYVVLATKRGIIKKTQLSAFANVRDAGIKAIKIDEDDELIGATLSNGKQEIFLSTRQGQSIRFNELGVRPMGRVSRGVRGIRLAQEDWVVAMDVVDKTMSGTILTVTENGYGKRTALEEYRLQNRGGSGIITIQTTERNGCVIGAKLVHDEEGIMVITDHGQLIRMPVQDISTIGRNTQGVRLIQLNAGEKVVSVTRILDNGESEEPSESA